MTDPNDQSGASESSSSTDEAPPADAVIPIGDFRTWLPPGSPEPELDDLITREELLEEIRAVPMRMSESTLRLRESQGILPRPMRRWRDGATRALYPRWMAELVIFSDILLDSRLGNPAADPSAIAAKTRGYVPGILERAARWRSTALTDDIPAALARLADLFSDAEKPPTQASITLRDADGGLIATFNGIQIPST